MKNVEIKAVVRDIDKLHKIIQEMNLGKPTKIEQEDTFFKSQKGRLKMRKFQVSLK